MRRALLLLLASACSTFTAASGTSATDGGSGGAAEAGAAPEAGDAGGDERVRPEPECKGTFARSFCEDFEKGDLDAVFGRGWIPEKIDGAELSLVPDTGSSTDGRALFTHVPSIGGKAHARLRRPLDATVTNALSVKARVKFRGTAESSYDVLQLTSTSGAPGSSIYLAWKGRTLSLWTLEATLGSGVNDVELERWYTIELTVGADQTPRVSVDSQSYLIAERRVPNLAITHAAIGVATSTGATASAELDDLVLSWQ